jgi:hypothetical protein
MMPGAKPAIQDDDDVEKMQKSESTKNNAIENILRECQTPGCITYMDNIYHKNYFQANNLSINSVAQLALSLAFQTPIFVPNNASVIPGQSIKNIMARMRRIPRKNISPITHGPTTDLLEI